LRNTIRRACILANEPVLTPDLFPFAPQKAVYSPAASVQRNEDETTTVSPLWVVERSHIQKVLELVDKNKSKAAKLLEIDRKTLYSKLERYGLDA
jgi:two-component system NtrC family response regulator